MTIGEDPPKGLRGVVWWILVLIIFVFLYIMEVLGNFFRK